MKLSEQKNIPWAFLALLILVLLMNLIMVAPYLLAIYFGWIFSTVLSPLQKKLESKNWKTERAALFSTLVALFTIILPIGGFGFALVKSLIRLIGPYTQSGFNIDEWLTKIFEFPIVQKLFDSQAEMKGFLDENSRKVVGGVTASLSSLLSSAPELALQMVLALLATYFILVDGKRLQTWISPRIPLPASTKADFAKGLNDTAYSSFLSMLAAAIAQSMVVFIGFMVLGVPMALLALGVGFVCAWFPIFGVTPVWAAACVYLFATGQIGKGIAMVGFGIVASLIDNVVRPWVLKGRADMHPLVSLVAIFGGIAYLGIPGVLVGPVVVSFAIAFLRVWPDFARQIGLKPGPALIDSHEISEVPKIITPETD